MSTAAIASVVPGPVREPPHLPSVVLAAGVHLILLSVLVFGISWQSRAPEAISVELWNLPPVQEVVEPTQIGRAHV